MATLFLCGWATAQTFSITQGVGGDSFGPRSVGQTFTPGVGIVPTTSVPILELTRVRFFAGNAGARMPSATTYLNIYDGDPNAGGAFVASSTNSLDTNGLTYQAPLIWTFGSVTLQASTEYWAVMSSTGTAGSLDVEVSLDGEPRGAPNRYVGGSGIVGGVVPSPGSRDLFFDVTLQGSSGSFVVGAGGCPGSAGTLALSAPLAPRRGRVFQLDVANVGANALAFAVFGLSDTAWNGTPLPVALSAVVPGANPACLLEVSPDDPFPLTVVGSAGTVVLQLPTTPSIVGTEFFVQAAQFDTAGLSVSAKAAGVVGF